MKSSKMIDILKTWIKKYGGKYKIIKTINNMNKFLGYVCSSMPHI